MTKAGSKSSASSATRKKHVRKAVAKDAPPTDAPILTMGKKPKGKDKGKNKEPPRKKAYVPPVKPQPVQQDPIDTYGLAQRLPAELLVVLRGLSKKDTVTKTKALEELRAAWIDRVELLRDDDDHQDMDCLARLEALTLSLPVWMHHAPALFLHPSRRLRTLALTAHAGILRSEPLRARAFFYLCEVASAEQVECVLGSWCMATRDAERQVALVAQRSWDAHIVLSPADADADAVPGSDATPRAAEGKLRLDSVQMGALLVFMQRALLDPLALHAYLNPVQVPVDVIAPRVIRGRPVPTPVVAAQTSRADNEPPTRAKGESDEESETDRKARLRIGALGALQCILGHGPSSLEDLFEILSDARLWSSLHHAQTCPFANVESFGYGQPVVRSYAWTLLLAMLETWPDKIVGLVPMLSVAVLRSSFSEPSIQVRGSMWRPLLKFLKSMSCPILRHCDSDSEEAGGSDEDRVKEKSTASVAKVRRSPGFTDFLQFLEIGCGGSPQQGYPAVLVILSSIPSSILLCSDFDTPAGLLFASFWAAVDGRAFSALDRTAKSAAFLSALLECTTFVVRRMRDTAGDAGNSVYIAGAEAALLRAQYARVWEECASRRLRVEEAVTGELVAKSLVTLNEIDSGLFDAAWDPLVPGMKVHLGSEDAQNTQLLFSLLKAFRAVFVEGSHPRFVSDESFQRTLEVVLDRSREALLSRTQDEGTRRTIGVLLDMVDTFGGDLFVGVSHAKALDGMILEHAGKVLSVSPKLLTTYLSRRDDHLVTLGLWRSLLESLPSHPVYAVLPPLLEAVEQHTLPDHLKPARREFDRSISAIFADAMGSANSDAFPLLLRLIRCSGYFVTDESFDILFQQVIATFGEILSHILHGDEEDTAKLDVLVNVIAVCLENRFELGLQERFALSLLPDVFVVAFLLPKALPVPGISTAEKTWKSWWASAPLGLQRQVWTAICARLQDAIFHTSTLASPLDILRAAADSGVDKPFAGLDDLLPTSRYLDDFLCNLRLDPAVPSLAILHPLIPPSSSFDVAEGPDCEADRQGLGVYARGVLILLYAYTEDRELARANLWALRHFLALAIYAGELLNVPTLPNPAFSRTVEKDVLRDVTVKIQQLTTYLLTTAAADDVWHMNVVTSLLNGNHDASLGDLASFTVDLVKHAQDGDDSLHVRILHTVLQYVLRDTTREEADQWLLVARKLDRNAPETSIAIVLCVTQFDRYRNELAAGILGIPASKANTDGLLLLRRLAATAPDPDSDVVFLSQPRAVNFVKACQGWIASDEEIDEDVESEITNVFFHLVPILQTVSGSHWDFIFDLIENNLETASFEDDATLTVLWRTIRLIQVIQDQVRYNKALRADWKQRETTVLSLLRDTVASEPRSVAASTPRAVCREAALRASSRVMADCMLIISIDYIQMSHLLFDPSTSVQTMAYGMLREAAHKRTEHLVIEAGVDTESVVRSLLPLELVSLLQQTLDIIDVDEDSSSRTFGTLLGWMIALDLYSNASMKVKSGYSEHLQELGLVDTHLIPLILNLLQLYGGVGKAVKLDMWSVDQFYIELYDPEIPLSIRLLAAHVYYRALLTIPSLIRSWLVDCKDKNLSTTVTSYTATHFSPVIIDTELTHIKSPEGLNELNAENLTIKVANAVNEVTAAYNVDEHQLELTLKIPNDWPLQRVTVKDSKRIGVPENRWRGWLLGVQQIVWSQNGRIVDAISLFKKNVTLHFEGQTECAICYSIISLSDGSLPRKPCKTCKNRFHSSCLYKWFNTSHSSSCPLCRSEFM
ncbi:hypothetical protein B0F90DRAFT_1702407 [Multifurca ochricompacta]|uniref:E3 ubiquitin-protein ligase listerin n=1 Tax=Multifurca ochricompacta TaxID=376703 RepID=A0AAD4M7U3_9AGAM|nr:hypothetical protein B0F90DRAFT_1702407 [Multifurca ochricompacta]